MRDARAILLGLGLLAGCGPVCFVGTPVGAHDETGEYDLSQISDAGLFQPDAPCQQVCHFANLGPVTSCVMTYLPGYDGGASSPYTPPNEADQTVLECGGPGLGEYTFTKADLLGAGLNGADHPCEWTCVWMLWRTSAVVAPYDRTFRSCSVSGPTATCTWTVPAGCQ